MQKNENGVRRASGWSEEGAEDRVSLLGLSLRTTIGVYPEERRSFRDLEADVRLAVDLRTAGRSDDLADTIDYAALAGRLRAVAAAEIALRKPGAVPGALAEVRIVRRRKRRHAGGSAS